MFTTSLGAINSPNTLGVGCNYIDNAISLAGKFSSMGLPNFGPYYFKELSPPLPFTTAINCLNVTFTPPVVTLSNCSGSTNGITSVLWDFGDPGSGASNTSIINNPAHSFSTAGIYNVKLILRYACGVDTLKQNVIVSSCGCQLTGQFTKGTANCTGCGCKEWILVTAGGGASPYIYSWQDGYTDRYKNHLCPGSYTINIKDKNGCSVNVNLSAP